MQCFGRRWIEAPRRGAGPSELWNLVDADDPTVVVIVSGGVVEVLMLVVVVVVIVVVVIVVMVVVTADRMVMAVATGVDMGRSFAMGVGQERKGTHPGRHQGDRQEEHRMEAFFPHGPSLYRNSGGGDARVRGFDETWLSHEGIVVSACFDAGSVIAPTGAVHATTRQESAASGTSLGRRFRRICPNLRPVFPTSAT